MGTLTPNKTRPLLLYGALLYPIFWTANFVAVGVHVETMNDLPLVETAGSLCVIFGGGLTALALVRRERPIWLGFLCLVVYALLGWYYSV